MPASREVLSIIEWVETKKIPYRVTATVGHFVSARNPCSPHSPGSFHCAEGTGGKGLAVDFGGVVPGVNAITTKQMTAIFDAFRPVAPLLAELFFNGPGVTRVVKDGVWRDGLQTLGAEQWAAHRSHVHVAVRRGIIIMPPNKENPLPDDPNTPNLPDIKFFIPIVNSTTGECRGYYIVSSNGELHSFGPGAPYFGRSEVPS